MNQRVVAMSATLSKSEVIKAVEEMPSDDLDLDDLIERLILLGKIRAGLAEKGQGISHSDVVDAFKKPREQRPWK